MHQHLERHHPLEFANLQRQPGAAKSAATTKTKTPHLSIQESFNKARKIPESSKEYEDITQSITLFIAMDGLPVYTVAKPGFKQLIDHAFKSRYVLPSRNIFSDTTIPQLYNDTKAKMLSEIRSVNSCSATSDIWSSVGLYPYISLTIHYISDDWQLVSRLLETYPMPEDHTAQNICEVFEDMLELWEIPKSKIVSLTTDSAANMKLAGTKLEIPRISCLGHILHNAINCALSSDKEVEDAIAACKKISTKISISWKKRRELAEIQLAHNLPVCAVPSECSTRWNSKFKLITFILEQELAIRDLLKDRHTVHLIPSTNRFQVSDTDKPTYVYY